MVATKIEATVQTDGELHLTQLPLQKGDRVEAIIRVLTEGMDSGQIAMGKDEARRRFLEQARLSQFRSDGIYHSRDELHERN